MARKKETSTSPIDLQGVTIARDENEVLQNINLRMESGEFAYLTGPIGGGKSSLLEFLYGELPVLSGERAYVLGFDLAHLSIAQRQAMRRRMGIVFQSQDQLLYDRSVAKNLDFVLRATCKADKKERELRIEEALEKVKMTGKGYKMPHELSGGEAERICIARALIVRPDLILMDEPTSGLDPETSIALGKLMQEIAAGGTTVLMATHNYQLMRQLPATTFAIETAKRTLVRYEKANDCVTPESIATETL